MYSMTGYGSGRAERDGRVLTIELKSVNHRFLDLSIKMPKAFNAYEDHIRNTIKTSISRGHIDTYINIDTSATQDIKLIVNKQLVSQLMAAADGIAAEYNIETGMTAEKLFRHKEVLSYGEAAIDEESCKALIDTALSAAIESLLSMRASEGSRIKKDLLVKLDNVKAMAAMVKEIAPKQLERYRTLLTQRVQNALENVPIDESKILNEVIFYADKVAVDEEYTRLFAHVEHVKEIISKDEPIGRQLDFIVQEMNREANTIGSKCSEISILDCVLSLKTDIEKIREQVQNIE